MVLWSECKVNKADMNKKFISEGRQKKGVNKINSLKMKRIGQIMGKLNYQIWKLYGGDSYLCTSCVYIIWHKLTFVEKNIYFMKRALRLQTRRPRGNLKIV